MLISSFFILTIICTLQIRADVLKTYVESGGWKAFSWLMVFLVVYIVSQVATSLWLAAWSDDPILNGTDAKQQSDYRLGFYGLFGILQGKLLPPAYGRLCFHRYLSFHGGTPVSGPRSFPVVRLDKIGVPPPI